MIGNTIGVASTEFRTAHQCANICFPNLRTPGLLEPSSRVAARVFRLEEVFVSRQSHHRYLRAFDISALHLLRVRIFSSANSFFGCALSRGAGEASGFIRRHCTAMGNTSSYVRHIKDVLSIMMEIYDARKKHKQLETSTDMPESQKRQWTEVDVKSDEEEAARVSNVEAFKALQSDSTWGTFFATFGDGEDDVGELVMTKERFAVGGQAELYEVHVKWRHPNWREVFKRGDISTDPCEYVLKVFKKGTFLKGLKAWWPKGMFEFHAEKVGAWMKRRYNCDVVCGTLLEDGRFAFLMQREQEDLRMLIDRNMMMRTWNPLTIFKRLQHHGPFPKEVAEKLMYEVALGMEWLHGLGIVHRDLKAANVLVREIDDRHYCFVADYECSLGSFGTGFFRAPEVLRALNEKNGKKIWERPELFTEEADVYSYGMTCYEILTGGLPLEELLTIKDSSDLVIKGKRPGVPNYVDDWLHELLSRCWKDDCSKRPPFREILDLFVQNSAAVRANTGMTKDRAHSQACWDLTKTLVLTKAELIRTYWDKQDDKPHWSNVAKPNSNKPSNFVKNLAAWLIRKVAGIDVEVSNMEVFKTTQMHSTWGSFFKTFGLDGSGTLGTSMNYAGELQVGEKFAEGGQAEMYHANVNWSDPKRNERDSIDGREWILKVFNEGNSLQDLRLQWPVGLLRFHFERKELASEWKKPRHICDVVCGTLLKNGRFAFLMVKENYDLRTFIDRNMNRRTDQGCGPFPKAVAERMMHHIALGMDWLHSYDIVMRDMKAKNMLVSKDRAGNFQYFVCDYESSVGVVGSGFWRPPEVLQACRDGTVGQRPELFSKAVDIYGYGMTCYEILTGKRPFEGHRYRNYDLILIDKRRPDLPEFVDDWARNLLNRCWEFDPKDRPSAHDILEEFKLRKGGTSDEALDSNDTEELIISHE